MSKIIEAEYEELDNKTIKEKEQEKTNFTEEEAKIAAENVAEVLKTLDKFKSLNERRVDKMKKLKEQYDSLPEGHYKRKQIESKIYDLGKKVNPTIVTANNEGKKGEKSE